MAITSEAFAPRLETVLAGGGRPVRASAVRRKKYRPRVLLADDSEAVRQLTGTLLKRIGCKVDAVEHGEAALTMARRIRYDLILLDLDMPLMDGITAAREIRRRFSNSGTPIMAVSAFLEGIGDPEERNRLFDGEIAKPVSSEQLRDLLSSASRTSATSGQGPQVEDCYLPLADWGILRATMLRSGSESSASAVETAIAEMQACAARIELAIARGDGGPLKAAVSTLGRIALSCGAARLSHRATALLMAANTTPVGELRHQVTQVLGCVAETTGELTDFMKGTRARE